MALNLGESDAQVAFDDVLNTFLLHLIDIHCESIVCIKLLLLVNFLLAATDLT